MTDLKRKTDLDTTLEVYEEESPPSSRAELALVRQFGKRLRLVLDTGVEVRDLVGKAIQKLKDEFSDVLDAAELDRRLSALRNCKVVSAKNFERLSKGQQELNGNAFILYQVEGDIIHSIPIVSPHSEAILLWNTLLHEGTHLVAPPPHPIHDLVQGTFNYERNLGPLRFEHNSHTGKLDLTYESSDIETLTAKVIFWEGITDWIALQSSLPDVKDEREEELLKKCGYTEKQYITYLISKAHQPQKLKTAMKKSYVEGDMQPFLYELEIQFKRDGLEMYKALINVLKEPLNEENWERRIEKWMTIVDQQ